MKLNTLLTLAAVYLSVLGVGFMLAPRQLGIDAVPTDASPALIEYLRIFGGPMLGIGVLDWLTRKEAPSTARTSILLANAIGFCCVAAMDVWGVSSGSSRPVAKVFLVIHLLFAIGFVVAWRTAARGQRSHA